MKRTSICNPWSMLAFFTACRLVRPRDRMVYDGYVNKLNLDTYHQRHPHRSLKYHRTTTILYIFRTRASTFDISSDSRYLPNRSHRHATPSDLRQPRYEPLSVRQILRHQPLESQDRACRRYARDVYLAGRACVRRFRWHEVSKPRAKLCERSEI